MKTEHYTTIIAVLAILVMGSILGLGVLYPNGLLQTKKSVVISATGSAASLPKEGIIDIYANGTGNTTAIAVANLSLTIAKVNGTLSGYTDSNNITTLYYTVSKEYNSSLYVATEGIQVVIPNISNMTGLLQALSSNKDIYVQNAAPKFSAAQESLLMRQALQSGLKNATAQAEALTGNATLTASNITVTNYRIIAPFGLEASVMPLAKGAGSGSLFFNGNESITESVTVVFTYT